MDKQGSALAFGLHVVFAVSVAWLVAINVAALENYLTPGQVFISAFE